jgi:hypothetical protein
MCIGPVGNGQSYWGLIQIKISAGDGLSPSDVEAFQNKLREFLSGLSLGTGTLATLANATIKTDGQDETSIKLHNRSPEG